jgi:hypothetical protein
VVEDDDGAGDHPGATIERWAQFNATILREGEALDSERVIDAGGPPARPPPRDAPRPPRRSHRSGARPGHPELIARTTSTGTPEQVWAGVAAIEAEGFAGVVCAPMGPDVPGELEAMAELLG